MNSNFLKVVSYSAGEHFAEEFTRILKQYNIVHLKDIPEGIDCKVFYSDLTDQLGEVINVDEDVKTGNAISQERWTDVRYDKNFEYSFRHSNTRQPLHTDAAYTNFDMDVNFLFCVENAQIGGATTFLDTELLIHILKTYEPDLYEKLMTVEVNFGKGEDQGKKSKILSIDDRGYKLNWNYYRIMPDNPDEVKQLCEEFHKFLEERVVAAGLLTQVYLKPGEAVFIQDDRILHGRCSFYGNRNLIKGGFNFK